MASYVPRQSSKEVFLPPCFSILTWLTGNMSWLHLITRNFPWFIRAPLIGLLGPECYTNLIYNVQLDHIYCLKYGISKFLSLAIVVGSGIVKVPQIIKILQSKSARGLSLTGFILDSLGLIIIVCYNYRHDFPFSTYGESFLLLIQNIIIVTLIILSSRHSQAGLISLAAISAPAILLGVTLIPDSPIPSTLLQGLLSLSIPLALGSKIPQIMINYEKKSTGQLSSFLIFSSFLGCLARLFTTLTETGDRTLLINFSSGTILNGILSFQILNYWSDHQKPTLDHSNNLNSCFRDDQPPERLSDSIELDNLSSTQSNLLNSPHRSTSSSNQSPLTINLNSPRQWTRKAD